MSKTVFVIWVVQSQIQNQPTVPWVNLSQNSHNKTNHSFPIHKTHRSSRFTEPPLFMNNPLDTAGASPPAQSVIISPDAKPGSTSESDGVGGPTIKINVSYGSSLHVIHLPAQSTFGNVSSLSLHKILFDYFRIRLFQLSNFSFCCTIVLDRLKIRNCWNQVW